MRLFAESAWYATQLLPSQGMRWDAADDCCAKATMSDRPHTLTLLFRLNHAGLFDAVRAETRGAINGDKVVMMSWQCKLSGHDAREGMKTTTTGGVAWATSERRMPCLRGTISAQHYEFVT